MHRYTLGATLGEGAFGQVLRATHQETGEEVAIKTLKKRCKDFDSMMALPEVKALQAIVHEHVVSCKELVLDRKGKVHIVFELLRGGNLEALSRNRKKPLSELQIRSIFHQLLTATEHMHSKGYMHRDIKPENILVHSISRNGDIRIKLADLGLAKYTNPQTTRPHTTYVSTRWYRSPEILLRMTDYSFPSDLWAVGAVMAELICQGEPLFPGEDESDQIARIVALRGHPAMVGWSKGHSAMTARHFRLPKTTSSSLQNVVPGTSLPMIQLLSDLLEMDPVRRPSASEALGYPLFAKSEQNENVATPPQRHRASGVQKLDTARTQDPLSSRWTDDSLQGGDAYIKERGEGVEMQSFSAQPPSRVHLVQQKRTVDTGAFSIPNFTENEGSNCTRIKDVRRRDPAGHFDMRTK